VNPRPAKGLRQGYHRFVFVKPPFLNIQDVQMPLAQSLEVTQIGLADLVSLAKRGAFSLAGDDFRDIVGKDHADGVFDVYLCVHVV
jgi:hypothetical protein